MGKRSRQEKRRRALFEENRIPGGVLGAVHRGNNGQATPDDISFLARMRREQQGKDGYSGVSRGSSGSFSTSYSKASYNYKGQYQFNVSPLKEDGVFHCEESGEITAECPLKPKVPSVLIDSRVWNCLMDCTREYETEWIALLIGRLDKDSQGDPAYVIERFYFPPQTASGTHVDVPTGVKPKVGTIGAIHSHVGMGVFFSSTDKDHSNWPVEVVINRKEEYEAVSRHKLKCGEWAKSKTKVYLTGSSLPKAIKGQLDAAFIAGKAILDKGKGSSIAGVHKDDLADIPGYNHPYEWFATHKPCGSCGHYTHTKGQSCGAMDCKCVTYVPLDSPPDPPYRPIEEVCPISNCIREKNHLGYHRNGRNEYFQFGAGEGGESKVEAKVEAKVEQKQLPLTVPSPDDPTDFSALERALEEYCEKCEGEGMVEGFDTETGVWTATTCTSCRGDGLSEIGRIRKAETKVQ